MTNKTKNAKGPLLTPEQWKLFGCVLALVVGVMADGFVVALMPSLGIAVATAWNVVVLAVLAVLLLGGEK